MWPLGTVGADFLFRGEVQSFQRRKKETRSSFISVDSFQLRPDGTWTIRNSTSFWTIFTVMDAETRSSSGFSGNLAIASWCSSGTESAQFFSIQNSILPHLDLVLVRNLSGYLRNILILTPSSGCHRFCAPRHQWRNVSTFWPAVAVVGFLIFGLVYGNFRVLLIFFVLHLPAGQLHIHNFNLVLFDFLKPLEPAVHVDFT